MSHGRCESRRPNQLVTSSLQRLTCLAAGQAGRRRGHGLQSSNRNVLAAALTTPIRTGLNSRESEVDRFNFSLCPFIQTIEQTYHGFCLPSLFSFTLYIRLEPQQILFRLCGLTKQLPPLREQLDAKVL